MYETHSVSYLHQVISQVTGSHCIYDVNIYCRCMIDVSDYTYELSCVCIKYFWYSYLNYQYYIWPRHWLSPCSRIVYHGNNIRWCTGLRSVLDLGAAHMSLSGFEPSINPMMRSPSHCLWTMLMTVQIVPFWSYVKTITRVYIVNIVYMLIDFMIHCVDI